MTTVSGATGAGGNYQSVNNNNEAKEKKNLSIFDIDGDGTITVEEQKTAFNEMVDETYNEFKKLLDRAGFKIQEFKDKFYKLFNTDKPASNELDIKIADFLINDIIVSAEKEMLDIAKTEHQKRKEEFKTEIEQNIHHLIMSPASKEKEAEAEELKQLVLRLGEDEHNKEWAQEMLNLINTRYNYVDVKEGDYLDKIAENHLKEKGEEYTKGDIVNLRNELIKNNPEVLKNPNKIYPGDRIYFDE